MNFNEIMNATLNADHTVSVHLHKNYTNQFTKHFYLYCDDVRICELTICDQRESGHHFNYTLKDIPALTLGSEYKVYDDRYMYCYLNMDVLLKNDKICSLYHSDEVMGTHYHKYFTTFRVFSPLAKAAYVVVKKDGIESMVTLEKNTDTGIFSGRIQGDLAKATYYFMVRINGQLVSANDPYTYGLTSQSSRGVIVNPDDVYVDLKEDLLPKMDSKDAIIYEMSIRDMTSMKHTSIRHKGKFLGLTETSCKSKNANPIGLDYIKSLGITHVQIMPMYDFCTVCDENEHEAYNWGYDPLYYNTPEGSYSTDPKDPYSRIIELKKMVASFHKAGIRVIMDVVYNHVFNAQFSAFEKLCPSYYFKFRSDGTLSNGSFCGNELNSTRPMCRKFIVDSCVHWVKNYGIDGFRFDLMGLLDIDTIQEVLRECRKIKPEFILYGEGWDMPTTLAGDKMAKMGNAFKMPDIGFFNDRYRDIVKGKTGDMELAVKGYLCGDVNYIDGFKHCFIGSCLPYAYPPLFTSAQQSINYIECHDNATLYDKLKISNSYESEDAILRRINLMNAVTLLSFGIPFIHAGQEIGATKHGHYNSYNAGDEINHFDYNLMDERIEMVTYLKHVIQLRKKYPFFSIMDKDIIFHLIDFQNLDSGALKIQYTGPEVAPAKEVFLLINPNNHDINVPLEGEYNLVFNEKGFIDHEKVRDSILLPGISLLMVEKIEESK